jgi:hypothetical protein
LKGGENSKRRAGYEEEEEGEVSLWANVMEVELMLVLGLGFPSVPSLSLRRFRTNANATGVFFWPGIG